MPLPLFPSKTPSHPLAIIGSIIGIAAGKGGVGKSSLTVNLALALTAQGYRVGIMDTDIYGPSIRKMLPEDRFPSQKGGRIQPALCHGISMISIAYFRPEQEAAAVRAPIANSLVSQFIQQVDWGPLDFLLIDFPPGTGDVQLTLAQKANLNGAVIVTTPQEIALLDVRKAMSLFNQVKIPIIGIVENMSYYQTDSSTERLYLFGRGGGERLAREKGVPFLGQIPLDPLVCQCGDKGESLFALDPQSQQLITQSFQQVAQQMVNHVKQLQESTQEALNDVELVWKEMKS
jgi:ATP-binding protein involved in chromosome partitioning